ncbi:unnamed protein product [Lupinus luteus]|uniref:Transketolase N-terminal domain-containing protein n=1 Tax=Lupinus luteus TaxID=3873 RepID=A0AAV1YJF4_LUPLU
MVEPDEEDLKSFRQWGSRTPGHPANFETLGVEVTTGPLGSGIANAVGLTRAEKYFILGEVCQMEGISNEVASLAGHWGLGKLIAFYDDIHISIDSDTEIAFTHSVDKSFEGLGWLVIWIKNGNTSYDEIHATIKEAHEMVALSEMILLPRATLSVAIVMSKISLLVEREIHNMYY